MVPRSYLKGLDADDFDIPGIFGTRHARSPNSWRIICSYEDGRRHKSRLFANLAVAGQKEAARTWDLHHVVEGQHFADVDFTGQLETLYAKRLPCVLIAKEEHTAYNRLLHIHETDELYRDRELPADVRARSAAAKAAAANPAEHAKLRGRVDELLALYRNAYSGDAVLLTIAENVLKEALVSLR
jgi:hypothetical protein